MSACADGSGAGECRGVRRSASDWGPRAGCPPGAVEALFAERVSARQGLPRSQRRIYPLIPFSGFASHLITRLRSRSSSPPHRLTAPPARTASAAPCPGAAKTQFTQLKPRAVCGAFRFRCGDFQSLGRNPALGLPPSPLPPKIPRTTCAGRRVVYPVHLVQSSVTTRTLQPGAAMHLMPRCWPPLSLPGRTIAPLRETNLSLSTRWRGR
jgi:hypothetical protein